MRGLSDLMFNSRALRFTQVFDRSKVFKASELKRESRNPKARQTTK
jgi:hypothetical protein